MKGPKYAILYTFQKIPGKYAPYPPNKLQAFFEVVALNMDIFKLFLPKFLTKIHFKMHQNAPKEIPGEHVPLSPNILTISNI